MGFLDKVKGLGKEVGIGLSAQEQYFRAYEKGVLLQPPDYSSAAKHFSTANEKFIKEGDQAMARHAQANAVLYGLISSRDQSIISEVIRALEPITEIERIGSREEMIQTAPLIAELNALLYEFQAEQSDGNNINKKDAYANASKIYMKLGTSPLQIAEKLQVKGPVDKSMMRSFYCSGLSDYYAALSILMSSPAQAHDFLQKSATEFRQAMITDWSKTVDDHIAQVSSKTHCWICGREMQARDVFFNYYPAKTEEFHTNLLKNTNEDLRMIDMPGHITACTVCGSTIENQADRYATMRANEVREWIAPILETYKKALENHNERLKNLEAVAHRH